MNSIAVKRWLPSLSDRMPGATLVILRNAAYS